MAFNANEFRAGQVLSAGALNEFFEELERLGRIHASAPLSFADERLYLYSEGGVVGLAEANPAGYREHGRFELKTGRLPTWSHPVVSGGKLFLRDQDVIYAYDVRAK